MNSNTRRYVLIALCALALLYAGKLVIGIVGLSKYQEVSLVPAWIELSMFFGAALIPLAHALRRDAKTGIWLLVLWTPCILYVIGIGINLLVRSDLDTRFTFGVMRLIGWLAIATLFICEVGQRTDAGPVGRPNSAKTPTAFGPQQSRHPSP